MIHRLNQKSVLMEYPNDTDDDNLRTSKEENYKAHQQQKDVAMRIGSSSLSFNNNNNNNDNSNPQKRKSCRDSRSNLNNVIVCYSIMNMIIIIIMMLSFQCVHGSFTVTITDEDEPECFVIRVPKDRPSLLSGNFDSWSEHEHMHVNAWIERQPSNEMSENHDTNNVVWHGQHGLREDTFTVEIPNGTIDQNRRYMLCFQSTSIMKKDKIKLQLMEERKKMLLHQQQLLQQQRNNKGSIPDANMGIDGDMIRRIEEEMNAVDVEDDQAYSIEPITVGFNVRIENTVDTVQTLPEGEVGPNAKRAIELMASISVIERNWKNLLDHFDFLRNREATHIRLSEQINQRVIHWSIVEAMLVVGMSIGQVLYWRKFFEQRRYL